MSHNIGLIVTGQETAKELQIFIKTLELFHKDVVLWIGTDSKTDLSTLKHSIPINTKVFLDKYTGKTRQDMEALTGEQYNSLWTDFMYEKLTVIEWMFEVQGSSQGVWFMDADIIHCAPLPIIPEEATLALSPHYIRTGDENRFGKFNAGYLWIKDRSLLNEWRKAGYTSTFYEQKALEQIVDKANLYEFPPNVNFGWWRMFQSSNPPQEIQSKFSIFRKEQGIGIRYNGLPLQSIHTHSGDVSYGYNGEFNRWLMKYLERLQSHSQARQWKQIVWSS